MTIITRIRALRGPMFAAALIGTLGSVPSGCSGKSASKNPEISVSSFRADPSKMTAEEKTKYDTLMRSGQTPAKK